MKALTKRERMARAFRSQEVDRFPVSPRIWAWLAGEARSGGRLRTDLELAERFRLHHVVRRTTCGLRAPFRDVFEEFRDVPEIDASVEVLEEGRVRKVRRRIETPAGELEELVIVPPPGAEYGISPDQEKVEPLVKTADDIRAALFLLRTLADFDLDRYFREQEAIGQEGIVLFTDGSSSPSHALVDAMRLDGAMMLFLDEPGAVLHFLEEIGALWVNVIKAALDAGIMYYDLNCYNASLSAGWSPEHWRRLFLPHIKRVTELIHESGGASILFDDGKIMGNLRNFLEAGVDCIHTLTPPPVGDADLKALRETLGGGVSLWGGVDLRVILRGTPQAVRAEVKRVLDGVSPERGFILGTSDSIRDKSPLENVQAFYEAAELGQ